MTRSICHIMVKGKLDGRRSEWFEGWTITQKEMGTTVLSGQIVDQSALHGVLVKIRNLDLPIVSVYCVEPEKGED